jgi:hypothetical protein
VGSGGKVNDLFRTRIGDLRLRRFALTRRRDFFRLDVAKRI